MEYLVFDSPKQLHLFLGLGYCSTILQSSMILELDTIALMSLMWLMAFVVPHISKHFFRTEFEALYRIRI